MEFPVCRYEEWQNRLEKHVDYNICESMPAAFTSDELFALDEDAGHELTDWLTSELLNYGWIEGSEAFKRAVANLYKREIPLDCILQTNGGTGANYNALQVLVNPGDHVIVESPAYEPLETLASHLGAEVELWKLEEENDWRPSIEALRKMVRRDTKLIVLANATNPLGVILERPFLEEVVEVVKSVGAYVLCDEAFRPFDTSVDYCSAVELYEKAVVTNTMSKAYSLPGIRIGWVVACEDIAAKIRTLRDYTMVSCGVMNDAYAVFALEHKEQILARNRDIVMTNLEETDAWVTSQPRASWQKPKGVSTGYVQLDIPESDVDFALRLAQERSTLVIPGGCFDLPCGVRIGYCAHEKVLREGLKRLGEALAEFD
jgi:aspartate/methionine/tyrosine aminotransferase